MRAAGWGKVSEKRTLLPTRRLRRHPPLAGRDETARVDGDSIYTAFSQPKCIGKPSPDRSVAVSYSGNPTMLV
jgi:hypothetical protein